MSNPTKRILIFSLAYYPNFVSGAEAAVKEITDRISESDIEFHMVTNRYDSTLPKTERIGNVTVHRIGISKKNPSFEDLGRFPLDLNKPLYQFLAPLKAVSLNRKHRFDAIWSLMAHSAGVPAAIFTLFSSRMPYVLTLQEGDPIEHIERTMRPLWPLFTRAFTRADKVQAISSYLADWARSRGVPEEKIEIIHNGANPRDIKAEFSEEEIAAVKDSLGKQPGDIFLINTARLVHQKGFDTTIRALPELPEQVKLVVVGAGAEEKKLKGLAEELDLKDRVIFTGALERSEVTKYRKAADIFVGPSRSEGLGNAFLSAMASRLPVVATQEGGLAEFIFDAKRNPDLPTTGWAVDPDAPEQIAAAVKDILDNPEKVRQVTRTARELVLDEYNWDSIAQKMYDTVFRPVLNKDAFHE